MSSILLASGLSPLDKFQRLLHRTIAVLACEPVKIRLQSRRLDSLAADNDLCQIFGSLAFSGHGSGTNFGSMAS
jgi:hypothetical protein